MNRQKIFLDDDDKWNFLERLAAFLTDSEIRRLAFVMLNNHFHLLLGTETVSFSSLMRRLLTGYAVFHNRRHLRSGHLFQNRYKSILCQEYPYLLELVRCIHPDRLHAGIVSDMDQLDAYPFSGLGVLMGNQKNDSDLIGGGRV
ncbi:MAG: transposase [Desulfatirhabdiaceae bacterium]